MCHTRVTVPAVLARVTEDLNQPRGSDVSLVVDVPETWLQQGATLQLQLPRLLACARCEGGGCDDCGRSGAFGREAMPATADEPLTVTLPRQGGQGVDALQLRLPGLGALSTEEDLPPGHLLLTVRATPPGQEPSAAVQRVRKSSRPSLEGLSLRGPWIVLAIGVVGLTLIWWMMK